MSTEINPVVNIEEVEEQKTPSAPNRLKRVKLIVAYDGTNYHGWQVQKTVSSVCETMEKGLSKVCADGFLYNMVRAITGTVLYAAEGKLTPEDIPEILASGDRSLAGPTVPPGGLYMTRLWYEDERLNE